MTLPSIEGAVNLRHLPRYRVLLCIACTYCVLPCALDRHLKDIHHVSRTVRKHQVEWAQALGLADLADVLYPDPGHPPFSGMPIFDGYACTGEGCQHLCATTKRMQAHWRVKHSNLGQGKVTNDVRCRRVNLQTFFRGNCLRYFIVAGSRDRGYSKTRNVLSGAGSRLSRQPGFNPVTETSVEWLLVNHFSDNSFSSLIPNKLTRTSWRDQILQACADAGADFLRYAVLSVTASHVAFEHPESRSLYGAAARRYRHLALDTLPKRIVNVDLANFFTVFNFSRLMTLCCLAGIQLNNIEEGNNDGNAPVTPVLPEWVQVQIHGRALVWHFRGEGRIAEAMHVPAQPLYTVYLMPETDTPRNPYDSRLKALASALDALSHEDPVLECVEALDTLRRAWAAPYREHTASFRDVALMWIVRVPIKYLDLVRSNDPVALVVFAHFCVLWSLAEDHYWYMKGHAETIMTRISRVIDSQWQTWIAWPMAMLSLTNSIENATPDQMAFSYEISRTASP